MLLTRHRHRYRHRYRSTYAVSTVTGWGLRTAVGTRTRRKVYAASRRRSSYCTRVLCGKILLCVLRVTYGVHERHVDVHHVRK